MQLFWRRRCSGFRRAAFGAGDSETILKVDQFGFERGDFAGQHPLPASRRTSVAVRFRRTDVLEPLEDLLEHSL